MRRLHLHINVIRQILEEVQLPLAELQFLGIGNIRLDGEIESFDDGALK